MAVLGRLRGSVWMVAVVAMLVALAMVVVPCRAWGGDGHRIVAQIATEFLTPAAAKAVAQQVRTLCWIVRLLASLARTCVRA